MAGQSFANDGAWGAGTDEVGNATTGAVSTGGTDSVPGGSAGTTDANQSDLTGAAALAENTDATSGITNADDAYGGTFSNGPGGATWDPTSQAAGVAQRSADAANPSFMSADGGGGAYFDEGGPVDGDPDDPNSQAAQDPMTAVIQKSLGSVDQVLQGMYSQYGLGGGKSSSNGVPDDQQDAANMPTVPASQSNSGVAPQQPAPGALPPTSNPFGTRKMAANPSDMPGPNGGSWSGPTSNRPAQGTIKPITPAPGTWKLPARADAGGIPDDDEGAA